MARSRPTTRSTTAQGPTVDSIWALGLRNPYRAYYDAPTGRLFIGDVGGNDNTTSVEELELGVRGANYGWPNCRRRLPTRPTRTRSTPMRTTAATRPSRAASSTTARQFPSSYQGSYFFADYTQNWIKRLTFDASGNVTRRLQLRASRRISRRAVRRHRRPDRGAGRRAVLRRHRLLRHQRPVRRQQDQANPVQPGEPGADRNRSANPTSGPRRWS